MSFHFKCNVRPGDFWRMSMSHTYRSPMGVVNIVFTAAMIGLAVRFWDSVADWVQVLILVGILLFPFIQPFLVFMRARGQVNMIPADLELTIDDNGILVETGGKQEQIRWKRVTGMILERNMVIFRVDKNNGYFLPNHTLKKQREDLISFAETKLK